MNSSQIALLKAFEIEYDNDDVENIIVTQTPIITEGFNEELYEFHEGWGDHVLTNNEPGCEHPFAVEYQHHEDLKLHKIHRYSRRDRFRFTMWQLLGCNGNIPIEVKQMIKKKIGRKTRKSKIWNQVRSILKETGNRRYYNMIPQIISHCTKLKPLGVDNLNVPALLNEFHRFHYQWDNGLGIKTGRKYFPNLRFMALKMLYKYGVTYPYNVPLVRTLRKKKYLNSLFLEFE